MTTPPANHCPDEFSQEVLEALLQDLFPDSPETIDGEIRSTTPGFDPILIRDLLREARASGRHPAHLVLGRAQADAYRTFLREEYGGEAPKDLKDSYFLGLHIVVEDTPSKLALVGEKTHDAWDAQLTPLWKEDDPTNPADRAA